jgi:glycosyltransferase involved in cell wall biosynthesis
MMRVFFHSHDYNYPRSRVIVKGLKENKIDVVKWDFPHTHKLILRWLKLLRKYKKNCDAIIVGFPGGRYDWFFTKLLSIGSNKPLVFDAFISQYDTKVFDKKYVNDRSLKSTFYYYSDKIPCALSDIVLLDTNAHIKYFQKTFNLSPKKFKRLFVGTDDKVFYPRENKNGNGKTFTIIFYGTFIPLHGIEYIIHAAKRLERYPDIIFEILGYGQTHNYIMELCNKLKINNVVFREHWIKYENLPEFIKKGDVGLGIFGHTAKAQRVVPNKVYEILAMGKPLITGNSPAIREIGIKNRKNALLVRMASPEALADAILELKEDEKLRGKIGKEGYILFKERFTPRKIGSELKKYLEEIIK